MTYSKRHSGRGEERSGHDTLVRFTPRRTVLLRHGGGHVPRRKEQDEKIKETEGSPGTELSPPVGEQEGQEAGGWINTLLFLNKRWRQSGWVVMITQVPTAAVG